MENDFEKQVENMKNIAEMLASQSTPQVSDAHEEEISILKRRTATVDGYEVNLYFSRHDHNDYCFDVLQVQSKDFSYLPFNLVCKIGRKFLGDEGLGYLEFKSQENKVYCWSVKHSDGELILPVNSKPGKYQGFEFLILNHSRL